MSAEIIIVPEAEEQLREVHLWWLENMDGAPSGFLGEFESLTALLRETPSIGHPFRRALRPGIRRLYMPRSKYWIYYAHKCGSVDRVYPGCLEHQARVGSPALILPIRVQREDTETQNALSCSRACA